MFYLELMIMPRRNQDNLCTYHMMQKCALWQFLVLTSSIARNVPASWSYAKALCCIYSRCELQSANAPTACL